MVNRKSMKSQSPSASVRLFIAVILVMTVIIACYDRRDPTAPDDDAGGTPAFLTPGNHPTGWGQADCAPCHDTRAIPRHDDLDISQCQGCHGDNGTGTGGQLCVVCHQSPPNNGAHFTHTAGGARSGGHGGLPVQPAFGRSAGRLGVAMVARDDSSCDLCHQGVGFGTPAHRNGVADVQFGQGVSGDWSGGTCQVEICHGSGRPDWYDQGGLSCVSCHASDAGAFTDYRSGLHDFHVDGAAAPCDACHLGAPTTHYNRSFDNPDNIQPDGGVYRDETPDGFSETGSSGTCASMELPCHPPSFELPWAMDADTCGLCHKIDNDDPPTSGQHLSHTGADNLGMPCETCHYGVADGEGPEHNNGVANVIFDPAFGGTFDGQSCANVSCHGSGRPNWFDGGTLDCESCHRIGGSGFADPRSGKHAEHADAGYDCGLCHSGPPATHYNNQVDNPDRIVPDGGVYTDETPNGYAQSGSSGSCSGLNNPCHGGEAPWTTGNACGSCHGASADNPPQQGSHPPHASSGALGYDCSVCHDGFSDAQRPAHINGESNVAFDPGSLAGDNGAQFTGNQCFNVYCHGAGSHPLPGGDNNAPTWGDPSTATCGACHAASEENPPSTGSHELHLNFSLTCTDCHYDGSLHVNGINDVVFDPERFPDGSYSQGTRPNQGTCMDIGCHNDRQWD